MSAKEEREARLARIAELLAEVEAQGGEQKQQQQRGTSVTLDEDLAEDLFDLCQQATPEREFPVPLSLIAEDGKIRAEMIHSSASPAYGIGLALRQAYCPAVGGDGPFVWISAYPLYDGATVNDAGRHKVRLSDDDTVDRPLTGFALKVRHAVPAKSAATFERLLKAGKIADNGTLKEGVAVKDLAP